MEANASVADASPRNHLNEVQGDLPFRLDELAHLVGLVDAHLAFVGGTLELHQQIHVVLIKGAIHVTFSSPSVFMSKRKRKSSQRSSVKVLMNVVLSILKCVAEYLGEVLVAVVGVEEIEIPILGAHDERSCGDGLGGMIPHKLGADGVAVGGI